MAANNALKITDINFDAIKNNLRTYLSSQTELQDYDYDSSTIQTILNLLAYNTYMNSYYVNMIANESFLDSALIRNNVVSRAKMLGYTPTSARGSSATVRVQITPDDSPSSINVVANTKFTSTIDGISYTFATLSGTVINPNANGDFISNLTITEGDPVQESYTVSTVNPVRYYLNNENADTSSLSVTVQESSSNTTTSTFTLASDLVSVTSNSYIYFLQESVDQKYEIYFGDGVLGRNVRDGNIVRLNYNVCNGSTTNGANTFTAVGNIGGYNTFTLNTVSNAGSGSEQETIDSIKFNAPKSYQTQNRAVTINDYKNILLNEAPDLGAVNVWGGESNDPPVYGKVYISAKPVTGTLVSDDRKSDLVSLLQSRNVLTIEPIFIDPTYLYVVPTVTSIYDTNRTSKTASQILTQIENEIVSFESKNLGSYGNKFYYSRLLNDIDDTDTSVIASQLTVKMQKRFIPTTTTSTSYVIKFNNAIYNPHAGHQYSVSSSSFTYDGNTCYFDDDGRGNLRVYRLVNLQRRYVSSNAGTVNYLTGRIDIDPILITAYSGDGIKVNATPADNNISTVRNQIIQIADASISIEEKSSGRTEASVSLSSATAKATSTSDTGIETVITTS